MIPRTWSDVARILVFLIPAIVIAFGWGRAARPAPMTRDVIVTEERHSTYAWSGAVIRVASEARTEKVTAWRWKTVTKPDGTTIATTTAKATEREERRETRDETKETANAQATNRKRAEEHISIPSVEPSRYGAGLLFGIAAAGRRVVGGYADVRLFGPLQGGLWVIDPHTEHRAGGLALGVRW